MKEEELEMDSVGQVTTARLCTLNQSANQQINETIQNRNIDAFQHVSLAQRELWKPGEDKCVTISYFVKTVQTPLTCLFRSFHMVFNSR